jgi:Zn-dependent peptidase ImmA (M78 family)
MGFEVYRTLVSILKKECPPAFPISVKRLKMSMKLCGTCALVDKKFIIRIANRLDEDAAIDTLLHEWAHAIAWSHLHDALTPDKRYIKDHDATWGVAYAEVYNVYLKHVAVK